jgi:putative FmdB family regulatory protein
MPVHDYLCQACGESFEFLTLSAADTVACESCGSDSVSRQVASRIAVRGRNRHRGGVVDLSSGACPCTGHGPGHRHH